MGSDRKSKKRRSPSISDSEGDGGRSSKHRAREEKGRSSRSKREKEKSKSKKSHKHSHRSQSDRGDKSKDKHDHKRHKHRHQSEFQELSNDDYFSKNNEFATWLKEEKGVFFSDLSSDGARELFSSFVNDWNNQKLESRYYKGIATGPRTAHNWKIKFEK